MGAFVDISSLLANICSGFFVTLMRRHEFVAAVALPVVAPIRKRSRPFAGILFVDKWPAGQVESVFDRKE
jgi:hypothetical protein